jgi:ATP-dependent DNA helicase RecG
METAEFIGILERGEDSRHQFKKNVSNPDALAAEFVAFSNGSGGRIFIGVDDSGTIAGLTNADILRLNQLVSNTASQGVQPAINPMTENVMTDNGLIMVVDVPAGINKPYRTRTARSG